MKISDASLKEKIEEYKKLAGPSLLDALGIEITECSKDRVVGTMPVNSNTKQPFGILHGGASVCLAESLASIGGWLNLEEEGKSIVGLEINANHLKMAKDGIVTGVSTPIHIGSKTQIWQTEIRNEKTELICVSRMTLLTVSNSFENLSNKE